MNLAMLDKLYLHLSQYTLLFDLLRALAYFIFGYVFARLASKGIVHLYERHARPKYSLLIGKITFYGILIVFVISALRELGFDLKVLLGATGILTVALGFASQTSASNFISGLFLLGERAFQIGDTITIDGITGEVIAIDLFSVKLKQGDNTVARIPNEMIIKTQIINLTRYPQRRYECLFTIPAEANISELRKVLLTSLSVELLCAKIPAPQIEIKALTEKGITLQLYVWAKQKDFSAMQYLVQRKLLETLRQLQIDFSNTAYYSRLIKEFTYDNAKNHLS